MVTRLWLKHMYSIVSPLRPVVVWGKGCQVRLFVAGGFIAKPVKRVIVTLICLQVNNLVVKTVINWVCLWWRYTVGK